MPPRCLSPFSGVATAVAGKGTGTVAARRFGAGLPVEATEPVSLSRDYQSAQSEPVSRKKTAQPGECDYDAAPDVSVKLITLLPGFTSAWSVVWAL